MGDDRFDAVVRLLTRTFGLDGSAIGPATRLEALDLDSLDRAELALALEDEGVVVRRFTDEEIASARTVGDVVALVRAKETA